MKDGAVKYCDRSLRAKIVLWVHKIKLHNLKKVNK